MEVAMSLRIAVLRAGVGIVVIATAWACELEGDPPTQVPLDDASDALAQAYCERMFDCQCDRGRRFEMIAECRDWIDEQVTQLESEARGAGLTYDPACFGIIVDRLDALDCAPTSASSEDVGCVTPCYPLHGDVPAGETCEQSSDYSNCAQGLECRFDDCDQDGNCVGRCADPCLGACATDCGDDARCIDGNCEPLPGIGQDCSEYGCASGLVCFFDEGGARCGRAPELGDDCTEVGECAEDLRCDRDPMTGEGTCVGPTALGSPCTGHTQCASGFCPAGFCDELPGEGDSCEGTFACSEGLDCDFDTRVCVPGDALVCQLSFEID